MSATPITDILLDATDVQLLAARDWTSAQLHVRPSSISKDVAIGYVVRHFEAGALEGWEGFITDLG